MNSESLINDLIEITKDNRNEVESFKNLSTKKLNYKKNDKSWSVLECIEHLNRYGDFYILEIKKQIKKSNFEKSSTFKSGVLGDYFAKIMLPKEKMKKMKTFKSMDPNNSFLDRNLLDKFIFQQETLLDLLTKAKTTNLTKIKTPISISKRIKLRLGDTFRVVIYHNMRHILQAKNVLR